MAYYGGPARRAARLAARRFSQRKNAVNGKDDRTIAPLPGREFPKPHSPLWLALRSPVAAQPEEVVAQRAAQKAALHCSSIAIIWTRPRATTHTVTSTQ